MCTDSPAWMHAWGVDARGNRQSTDLHVPGAHVPGAQARSCGILAAHPLAPPGWRRGAASAPVPLLHGTWAWTASVRMALTQLAENSHRRGGDVCAPSCSDDVAVETQGLGSPHPVAQVAGGWGRGLGQTGVRASFRGASRLSSGSLSGPPAQGGALRTQSWVQGEKERSSSLSRPLMGRRVLITGLGGEWARRRPGTRSPWDSPAPPA